MSFLRIFSPSKVNLFLKVLFRRPDGYHELQSVIQPVSVFDELTLFVERGEGITLSGSGRNMPSDSENLAVSACSLYIEAASLKTKISISIKKNIPLGSGLGGGSANAAAVLVGLNRIFGKFADRDLFRMAASLGADVSFFIRSTTSLVEGVGERVTPLLDFPLFHYVIVFPKINVSTADVYRKWKPLGNPPSEVNPGEIIEKFRRGEFPLLNDLEDTVCGIFPEVLSVKETLCSLGARAVLLSGSGSCVFSVFKDTKEAERIYEYLRTSPDFDVFLARGISGWNFLAD